MQSQWDPELSGHLGLNIVYTPAGGHQADIVFVHGLGGTSRATWTKNKNSKLFWPLKFLAMDPELCIARILTLGYDASFRKHNNPYATLRDFAKELWFDLAQHSHLNIGRVKNFTLGKMNLSDMLQFTGTADFCRPQHGWPYCERGTRHQLTEQAKKKLSPSKSSETPVLSSIPIDRDLIKNNRHTRMARPTQSTSTLCARLLLSRSLLHHIAEPILRRF